MCLNNYSVFKIPDDKTDDQASNKEENLSLPTTLGGDVFPPEILAEKGKDRSGG